VVFVCLFISSPSLPSHFFYSIGPFLDSSLMAIISAWLLCFSPYPSAPPDPGREDSRLLGHTVDDPLLHLALGGGFEAEPHMPPSSVMHFLSLSLMYRLFECYYSYELEMQFSLI
jgi:hypothetical protein